MCVCCVHRQPVSSTRVAVMSCKIKKAKKKLATK